MGLFANDSKVYNGISSLVDSELLQKNFDFLTIWSKIYDRELLINLKLSQLPTRMLPNANRKCMELLSRVVIKKIS